MTQIEAIMALADEYADSCVGWHMVRNVETWHAREKTNAAKQQKDDDREALRAAIEQAAGKIAKGPNYSVLMDIILHFSFPLWTYTLIFGVAVLSFI